MKKRKRDTYIICKESDELVIRTFSRCCLMFQLIVSLFFFLLKTFYHMLGHNFFIFNIFM